MKVGIYVPHGALPDVKGFAPALAAFNFATHLRTVTPVCLSAQEHYSEPHAIAQGIEIYRIKQSALYRRVFTKMTRWDPWPLYMRAAHLINQIRPDLFHVHQLEFEVAAFRAKLKRAIPILVHAHVTNRAFRPERGMADRYIAVSDYVKQKLIEQGYPASRIDVVPNGVDTLLFKPVDLVQKQALRHDLNLPDNAFILLFTGRKQTIKGFHLFLQVADNLLTKYPDLIAVAVGSEPRDALAEQDYPQRQVLRARLSKTGRWVDLPGVSQVVLAQYYQVADLVLLPSIIETQGMAMLEAMACGCATISCNAGGVKESIIDQQSGFLLNDPQNKEEAISVVERLIQNDSALRTIGQAARVRAVEQFDWGVVSAKLEQCYQEAFADNAL